MIDKLIQALEREHAAQLEGCAHHERGDLRAEQDREMRLVVAAVQCLRTHGPDTLDVLDTAFDAAIEHEVEAQLQRDASLAMDRRLAQAVG